MKFQIIGVAIHPEKQNEILRPMVKDLSQLDLPFLSYGQKTVNFLHFSKNRKNILCFSHNSKTVSPIELIPSPEVLEFYSSYLDV